MVSENDLLLPRLNVEPCDDPNYDWVSKNGGPQFTIANPLLFAGRWLMLNCQVTAAAKISEPFTIYQDTGAGWSESTAIRLFPSDEGNINHIWKCLREVKEIRVDPIERSGKFSVRSFLLEPIINLVEPVPLTPVDNALDSLFSAHRGKVSDKWSSYIPEYARLFSPYRDLPIRLLEIGIQNGGSLEIWSKYFANAKKVVGCDINPECAKLQFENPRIVVIAADANTDDAQQQVLSQSKNFDLIIDDASHRSSDIVHSFARYFPYLNDGGLYVVEDLHCSYWQRYEGGIFQPHSAMTFFKQLADTLNHEHWGIGKVRTTLLRNFDHLEDTQLDDAALAHIHSIEFINSICVVKKAPPSQNILGKRLVVGQVALVDSEFLPHSGSSSSPEDQSSNYWSMRDLMPEEDPLPKLREIDKLNERQYEANAQLISLRQQLERQSHSIAEFEAANAAQLLRIRLDHAQQVGDLQTQFAAKEQTYLDHLSQARQQLENGLRTMAEREEAFSQRLQQIEATHSKQSEEQSVLSAAREQLLMDQLMQAQQHFTAREHKTAERAKDLQAQVQAKQEEIKALTVRMLDIGRDLDGIQASYSWRLTAPFRRLVVAFRKSEAVASIRHFIRRRRY